MDSDSASSIGASGIADAIPGVTKAIAAVAAQPSSNRPPVANKDVIVTDGRVATIYYSTLLKNDLDPDGDALAVTNHTNAGHGSLTAGKDGFTYTPVQGFTGTDHFSYTVSDGHGGTASAVVDVQVPAASMFVDVFRFYNTATGTHFYSGSLTEKDRIVENPSHDAFLAKMNFEGASYKAFFEKSDSNVDLFRFYNTATGAHFFTAFGWEKDAIVSNPTHDPFLAGMTFEGTAYYVLPQGGEHALPVWRFYNGSTGVHFYTASAAEKDGIVANPAHDPYLAQLKLEGIAYWVPDDQWHA